MSKILRRIKRHRRASNRGQRISAAVFFAPA
jgi:hypothetical protein